MARKVVVLPLLLLLLALLFSGCRSGPSAEDKYKASFEKIWTELAKEQKNLDGSAVAMKNDSFDTLILVGENKEKSYQKAKKELSELTPPQDLKKLHRLMISYLDNGIRYFSEAVKIFKETAGNYSQDQLKDLQEIQKKWLTSENKVKREMKAQGWTFQ